MLTTPQRDDELAFEMLLKDFLSCFYAIAVKIIPNL
jgi:hypothetical protein